MLNLEYVSIFECIFLINPYATSEVLESTLCNQLYFLTPKYDLFAGNITFFNPHSCVEASEEGK